MNKFSKQLNKIARKIVSSEFLTIWTISKNPDIEFGFCITEGFLQIGMGGEWWSGNIKSGKNILHHKKEKIDDAYKPVFVTIVNSGDYVLFTVSGGFYPDVQKKFMISVTSK